MDSAKRRKPRIRSFIAAVFHPPVDRADRVSPRFTALTVRLAGFYPADLESGPRVLFDPDPAVTGPRTTARPMVLLVVHVAREERERCS